MYIKYIEIQQLTPYQMCDHLLQDLGVIKEVATDLNRVH